MRTAPHGENQIANFDSRDSPVTYWLDLFTGTTWDEFRRAGGNITGFREKQRARSSKVKPGDIFLCYLTGVMRWVGALEVIGPSDDSRPIWSLDFPTLLAHPDRFCLVGN